METDGTQSFMAPRYRGDWWDAVPRVNGGLKGLSPFRRPGTRLIGTGGTESFLAPSYPGDWRDSIRLAPEVPWGLVGLSTFWPPGTLGNGGTQSPG